MMKDVRKKTFTPITKSQVKHIAHLAHIAISDEEIEKFQKQFGDIIKYFNRLQEIDTNRVEETSQITGLTNEFREDKARDFLTQDHALQNAPEKKNGYFRTLSPLK